MISLEMWQNFAVAGTQYVACGFKDLPQPWTASVEAIYATLPPKAQPSGLTSNGEHILLGSAEQAFIDRMLDGSMKPGRWQATTPCFREELVIDGLHKPYFMKLELIDYMPSDPDAALQRIIADAALVLGHHLAWCPALGVEKTEQGYDLMLRGHEIGSYGIREYQGHHWVYGTGLAEPRFTTIASGVAF
jgi:hypothetical protein